MAINKFRNSQNVQFNEARQEVDLLQSVNLHAIQLRITGTLDVAAGGGTDGTLLTDPVARLLQRIRVAWDGMDLVDLSGADLAEVTRRIGRQQVTPDEPADAAVQADTALRHDLIIPFTRDFLANPIETVFPSVRVRQQLKVFLTWERGASGGTSDAGTGAIIDGGDRDVTLTDVECSVTEIYSTGVVRPWYIPVLRVETSQQFNSAAVAHPLRLRGDRRFDSVLLRSIEDATEEPAALINEVSLVGGVNRFIDDVPFDDLKAEEIRAFHSVPEAGSSLMVQFVDNGKLGTVVNPNDFTDPRFEFDVDAPGTNPGQIRAIMFELAAIPGITRVER